MTDYANGVKDEATPVEQLVENMAASDRGVRRGPARGAPARGGAPQPPGVVYRFTASD